jgi:hypothetical protein
VADCGPGTVSLLAADDGGQRPAVLAIAARHAGVPLAGPDTGRDLVLSFRRAADALACALALQRERALPVGVHSGGAGSGAAVSHCGCLRDCAAAGQVVVSQATADLVAGGLPGGAALTDLGWHRLADLGPPERLWQLARPGLPPAFPPLRSLDPRRHNLPVQLASFVGRRGELATVTALLRGARLVTLTARRRGHRGPGRAGHRPVRRGLGRG